jgi:hypothetical protein
MPDQTWDEITSDPRWASLDHKMQVKARALYAKTLGQAQGKAARAAFLQEYAINTKPTQAAEASQGFAKDFGQGLAQNAKNLALGAAQSVLDEGPSGLARRASQRVADAVVDNTVGKAMGWPKSEQTRRAMGQPAHGRLIPPDAVEPGVAAVAGKLLGGAADPAYALMPAAKLAKPAASVAQAALRGALRTAPVVGAIGGATYAGNQLADQQAINPGDLALNAAISAGLGGAIGGLAGGLGAHLAKPAPAPAAPARGLAGLLPEPKAPLMLPAKTSGPVLPSDGTVIHAEPVTKPFQSYGPVHPNAIRLAERDAANKALAQQFQGYTLDDLLERNALMMNQKSAAPVYAEAQYSAPIGPEVAKPAPANPALYGPDDFKEMSDLLMKQGKAQAPAAPTEAAGGTTATPTTGTPNKPPRLAALADALEAKGQAILKESSGRLHTGIDTDVLTGHAHVLAAKMLRGYQSFVEWWHEMAQRYGEGRFSYDQLWKTYEYAQHLADPETHLNPHAPPKAFDVEGAKARAVADLEKRRAAGDPYLTAEDAAKAQAEAAHQKALEDAANHGRPYAPEGGPGGRYLTADVEGFTHSKGSVFRKATPDEVARHRRDQEHMRRLEDYDENALEERVRLPHLGDKPRVVASRPYPREDLGEPQGSTFRRLLTDETGALDLGALNGQAGRQARETLGRAAGQSLDAALSGADLAGRPLRAADQAVEGILDKTLAKPVGALARGVVKGKDALKARMRQNPVGEFFLSTDTPGEYKDMVAQVAARTAKDTEALVQEARRLEEAGVDQAKLYETVTDRAQTTPEAEAVRAKTTPISRELRDLGALTPEQFKAWEDQYLPRTYLNKNGPLGAIYRQAKATLKGSLHRGKALDLDARTVEMFNRDWRKVGETPSGQVIVRDAASGIERTVSRRNAGNYLGTWKILQAKGGGRVRAWRDWTAEERARMGEVKDVSVALRKMAQQSYRDLRNGRVLKAVSENPEWAVPDSQPAPEGWVHFSNQKAKTGVRQWGPLASHYVHPEIARDLEGLTEAGNLNQMLSVVRKATGMDIWKKYKTVFNPASHANQFFQNAITLEMAGGSAYDLPRAAQALKAKGPLIQRLDDLGLYGDGLRATEMPGADPGAIDWSRMVDASLKVAKGLDKLAGDAYQFSDDWVRTAYVMGRMEKGVPVEQAVKEAQDRFYNGNRVNSAFSRIGAATVLPFVKSFAYSVDRLPELVAANPAKATKLLLYGLALSKGMQLAAGVTDAQEEGRQAVLPDYQKGVGKTVMLPGTDTKGQRLMLDVGNWNPVGSVLDTTDRTALPEREIPGLTDLTGLKAGLPSALVPLGGPLGVGIGLATNYDPFYQKAIRTDTEDNTADYLKRGLGPTLVTQHLPKLATAIKGMAEYGGRRYDVPTAAANVLGFKIQPIDFQEAYAKAESRFSRQYDEITRKGRDLDRKLDQGSITADDYAKAMADLEGQANELEAKYKAWEAKAKQVLQKAGSR